MYSCWGLRRRGLVGEPLAFPTRRLGGCRFSADFCPVWMPKIVAMTAFSSLFWRRSKRRGQLFTAVVDTVRQVEDIDGVLGVVAVLLAAVVDAVVVVVLVEVDNI